MTDDENTIDHAESEEKMAWEMIEARATKLEDEVLKLKSNLTEQVEICTLLESDNAELLVKLDSAIEELETKQRELMMLVKERDNILSKSGGLETRKKSEMNNKTAAEGNENRDYVKKLKWRPLVVDLVVLTVFAALGFMGIASYLRYDRKR